MAAFFLASSAFDIRQKRYEGYHIMVSLNNRRRAGPATNKTTAQGIGTSIINSVAKHAARVMVKR